MTFQEKVNSAIDILNNNYKNEQICQLFIKGLKASEPRYYELMYKTIIWLKPEAKRKKMFEYCIYLGCNCPVCGKELISEPFCSMQCYALYVSTEKINPSTKDNELPF